MIGKSDQTVTDYCNEGKFPRANGPGGGKWAIPEGDVQAYLTGKPIETPIVTQGESEAVKQAKDAAVIATENFKRTERRQIPN